MDKDNVAALVLAAGQSSRMGALKPVLPIEGKPAVLWVVDTFRNAGVQDIRVVTGFHSEALVGVLQAEGLQIIENPEPSRGMLSSVQVGVQSLKAETSGFMLIPADMPMVRSKTIERILLAHQKNPKGIIYPWLLNERGHPPLITKPYYDSILEADPSSNLRLIMEQFRDLWQDVYCADNGILMDMDTPEDYVAMMEYAKTRSVPNRGECRMLFEILDTPDAVRYHGAAVCAVAWKLAEHLNQNTGVQILVPTLRAAALLHDVGKGSSRHEYVGAERLAKEGFGGLYDCVASHMNLDLPKGAFKITEKEILFLADKLVEGEHTLSLETRFKKTVQRYPHGDLAAIQKRFATANRIKEKIETILGIDSLYELLTPGEKGGASCERGNLHENCQRMPRMPQPYIGRTSSRG